MTPRQQCRAHRFPEVLTNCTADDYRYRRGNARFVVVLPPVSPDRPDIG
ncbi:hypothetical protein [Paraburkholderia sp.]